VTPFVLLLSKTPSPRFCGKKDLVKAAENADTGVRIERLNASHSPFLNVPVKSASDFRRTSQPTLSYPTRAVVGNDHASVALIGVVELL
jgi:hypothetical protein